MYKSFVQRMISIDDDKTIIRRGTFWNLISSILNSATTAIIMFFISLINDVSAAGMYSIASAIAYQCQAIGYFGVRNYHISDTKKKYSFIDYVCVNVVSCTIMIIFLSYLSFNEGYSIDKAFLIFFYGLYRAIDIFEALLHDEYQRNGRLDIGVVLQTIRFSISMFIMIVILLVTGSVTIATGIATLVSIFLVYYQNKPILPYFVDRIGKSNITRIKELLIICFPIFGSGFINMYLANASKYAIEANLNDYFQGIYAILIVPVFTINLLSTVIYRPYISKMSNQWQDGKYGQFLKTIICQIFVVFSLTILITLFGYLIGLRLLSIIYGVDLMEYMLVFILLLLGGGVNTLGAFFNYVIIIIHEQNKNMFIYVLSGLFTISCGSFFVQHYYLQGAAFLYILSSLIIVLFSVLILVRKYREEALNEKR